MADAYLSGGDKMRHVIDIECWKPYNGNGKKDELLNDYGNTQSRRKQEGR
jgi:Txe/YoeB family toxin of Txe-Axe toxin-antitoxin module